MASEISRFLADEVYPRLDAVEAGLLDSLNPRRSGRAYALDCPACNTKKAAFYYPNSAVVRCNRRNNCGAATSVWDVLASQGHSPRDIVAKLAGAVGVEPPKKDQPAGTSPERRASDAIRKALTSFLDGAPEIASTFQRMRGWSDEHYALVRQFGLGYYPDRASVLAELRKQGVDLDVAESLGYLARRGAPSNLDNRVVLFWEQPNGHLGLVARALTDTQSPKYLYSAGMSRACPAFMRGYTPKDPLYAVEGLLDAIALRAAGYHGVAIGGAHVTMDQARYLSRRCWNLVHVVDADVAGFEGALATIRNCEQVGITVSVVMLPAGSSDPDELASTGKVATLQALIGKAVGSGQYAAGYFIHELESANATERAAVYRDFAAIERYLTPPSAFEYRTILRRHGIPADPRPTALRLLASLAALDLFDAGITNIRRLYDLDVSITPASGSGFVPTNALPDILRAAADILEARLEDSLAGTLRDQFGVSLSLTEVSHG